MVNTTEGSAIRGGNSGFKVERHRAVPTLKAVLLLVALAYLLTCAVVVINAFTWLPGLPDSYYAVQRALYWPFQPYFTLMGKLLGHPSISYATFVVITRAPLALIALWAMGALIKDRRRQVLK